MNVCVGCSFAVWACACQTTYAMSYFLVTSRTGRHTAECSPAIAGTVQHAAWGCAGTRCSTAPGWHAARPAEPAAVPGQRPAWPGASALPIWWQSARWLLPHPPPEPWPPPTPWSAAHTLKDCHGTTPGFRICGHDRGSPFFKTTLPKVVCDSDQTDAKLSWFRV